MKITAKHDALIEKLQSRYAFKQPLTYYFQGASGEPEQREQKAFIQCLMGEFSHELGRVLVPDSKTPHVLKEIYTRLGVSTADFVDSNARYTPQGKRVSSQMQKYKKMGYQDGQLDVTVFYPYNGFHAFLCEMKHGGGHMTKKGNIAKPGNASKEQKITIRELKKIGYYACVGKGFLDALGHWLTYLGK